MNLTRIFHFALPRAPVPIAPSRDPGWVARLRAAHRRWRRAAPIDGVDFQDTQPSIRDTGPTPT